LYSHTLSRHANGQTCEHNDGFLPHASEHLKNNPIFLRIWGCFSGVWEIGVIFSKNTVLLAKKSKTIAINKRVSPKRW